MDLLANLAMGFSVASSIANLGFCLIGVILGTLIGVLPGIGATATIAMLLPITFQLEPVSSLIMLAGIYYGAQYGGSTTAILINMPGESSSAVTAIDGYQMARKGRAGTALATAALGSFFAGSVATFLVALFAPPLTAVDVCRGVSRLLVRAGVAPLSEVPLGCGRRADILGLDPQGRLTLVEIKVSLADLRGDRKWPDYLDYCDRFFWAVPAGFDLSPLDGAAFLPERTGIIVADRYDAAIVREAKSEPLPAHVRKRCTLAFARRAARRLAAQNDPELAGF